jgi:hypothetical protein
MKPKGISYHCCCQRLLGMCCPEEGAADDDKMGPILQEIEAQHPEWKDTANRNLTILQWNSLVLRNGVLECHWESSSEQINCPRQPQ